MVVLKQADDEPEHHPVYEQQPGGQQAARQATDKRAERDVDVVRHDQRGGYGPLFLAGLRIAAPFHLVLGCFLGARDHDRRNDLLRQRGPVANHPVADRRGNGE